MRQTCRHWTCQVLKRWYRSWWTHNKAFKTRTKTSRRSKGDRIRLQAYVSCYCKTSAAQWNPSNINSPQARKQTWRHRVWVWKKDAWGVRETGMDSLPLGQRAEKESSHSVGSLSPTSTSPERRAEAHQNQNLSANSNGKLSQGLDPEALVHTRARCPDMSYHLSISDFSSN